MTFFSLLHICENEKSTHNSVAGKFSSQMNIYMSCAEKLRHSLLNNGSELILITNDKQQLLESAKRTYDIEIIENTFSLKVPSGIKFYSAHFKIEVYRYLSSLNYDYVGLIDCDMLCINPPSQSFLNAISLKIPLYYDITDQVFPAYTYHKIISDKETISKSRSVGLWAGGEFITGTPSFFNELYDETNSLLEDYFKNYQQLHHQGDEMITSVAIEKLKLEKKLPILNAGSLGIVARYWNAEILHVQKPLDSLSEYFLLHLPSDKRFISKLNIKSGNIFQLYKRHRRYSSLIIPIKSLVKKIISRL